MFRTNNGYKCPLCSEKSPILIPHMGFEICWDCRFRLTHNGRAEADEWELRVHNLEGKVSSLNFAINRINTFLQTHGFEIGRRNQDGALASEEENGPT